eukprot:scaffold57088_cov26-Tisochrysis_lutea.AAC.1
MREIECARCPGTDPQLESLGRLPSSREHPICELMDARGEWILAFNIRFSMAHHVRAVDCASYPSP